MIQNYFLERIVIEKLDTIKKLRFLELQRSLPVWKGSLSQSLFMYPRCYPPPRKLLNKTITIKFLWKGVDKLTRLSAINECENGGLKEICFETMVKSLRLTWRKIIFGENDGAWKK